MLTHKFVQKHELVVGSVTQLYMSLEANILHVVIKYFSLIFNIHIRILINLYSYYVKIIKFTLTSCKIH